MPQPWGFREIVSRRAVQICRPAALFTTLALIGGVLTSAQQGAVGGKLTDLYSHPLANIPVTLRDTRTGLEVHAVTERNGSYRFSGLPAGEYSLEAESPGLGYGRLAGIVVSAGHEARVQAAMAFRPRSKMAQGGSDGVVPLAGPKKAEMPAMHAVLGPAAEPRSAEISPIAQISEVAGSDRESSRRATNPEDGQGSGSVPGRSSVLEQDSALANSGKVPTRDGTGPLAANLQINKEPELPGPPRTIFTEETAEMVPRVAGRSVPGVANGAASIVAMSIRNAVNLRDTGFALAALCGVQAQLQAQWPALRNIELAEEADSTPPEVSEEKLQQLPVPGGNWTSLVHNQPAEQAGGADEEIGDTGQAAMPGGRQGRVTVDRADMQLAFGGHRTERAMDSSLLGPGRNEGAIREIAGSTRLWEGGGPGIDVTTQKGEHGLHGHAFLFTRQNLGQAQNPFSSWVKETSPGGLGTVPQFASVPYTATDRDLRWGMGLGGEFGRKRIFWLGALDGTDRNDPGVATVKHPENFFAQPSNDEMQVLSARLGLSSVNPAAEGLAAYSGMLTQLAGLLGPAARSSTQQVGFGRLDWEGAGRHRFTLEGSGSVWNAPGGGLVRASEPYGSHSFGTSRTSESWMLARWETFLTQNLLGTIQGSAGRHILAHGPETPSSTEQALMANAWGQLPQMVVDSRYGFTIGNPARFGAGSYPDEHLYEGQARVDWVHRRLLLKTGLDLRHNTDATGFVRNHLGTYFYSSVENFISDALVFEKYGLSDALDPANPHNCDQRGKAWRDATGQLNGLGNLPCYSHYTQIMGPTDWHLGTSDWAGFATAQWQPARGVAISGGLRWEREQTPPPIANVLNPELPLAGRAPTLGNEWEPHASGAWGRSESRLPVIRAGYGMYFGRTSNAVLESLLTQTGSTRGDLNLFMKPVDDLAGLGAPPFPYVLAGEPTKIVKPGAVEMAPEFHNPEVHQGEVSIEERLPEKMKVTVTALVSLGRHLPVIADTNIDPANPGTVTYRVVDASGAGPLKSGQLTVPFYAGWPGDSSGGRLLQNYQQIPELASRANSTYEAAVVRVVRSSRRGLSLDARYTYAHAMDWNPNETAQITRGSVLDPHDFALEYGTSDMDARHLASASVIWQAPWRVRNWTGALANGWMLSGIGHYRGGLPYTMRTAGSVTQAFDSAGARIAGLSTGMNGSGGDDRVYGVGRNTYRYPATWKADVRIGKKFDLGRMREVQLYAESFNLFNHQNVTSLETTGYYISSGSTAGELPTMNFLTGLKTGQTEFGKPLDVNGTDFFRPRQLDFGMRMRF